jgi:hypothetical protein
MLSDESYLLVLLRIDCSVSHVVDILGDFQGLPVNKIK